MLTSITYALSGVRKSSPLCPDMWTCEAASYLFDDVRFWWFTLIQDLVSFAQYPKDRLLQIIHATEQAPSYQLMSLWSGRLNSHVRLRTKKQRFFNFYFFCCTFEKSAMTLASTKVHYIVHPCSNKNKLLTNSKNTSSHYEFAVVRKLLNRPAAFIKSWKIECPQGLSKSPLTFTFNKLVSGYTNGIVCFSQRLMRVLPTSILDSFKSIATT
jgi:hypothetical protein